MSDRESLINYGRLRASDLENGLDRYCRLVRGAAWGRKILAWAPYAAALGSGVALTTNAGATIIYSGTQNLTVGANASSLAPIHMNLGGPENFYLAGKNAFETLAGEILGGGIEVQRLASGAAISANAGNFGGHQYLTNWGMGVGFAGVDFQIGGQTFYGWVKLDPTSTGDTAISWAYNDVAGGSILAGEEASTPPAVTPEPSSLSLMLLATGACGVLALRNRRKMQAATSAPFVSN